MKGPFNIVRQVAWTIILLGGLWGGTMTAADAGERKNAVAQDAWQGRYAVFVTAHRGFSGAAPENTLAAFRAAIEAGADMIELDVHLTRDQEVVVIHDDVLGRTADGKGDVAEKSLAELKALDAGGWFDPRFAGERIPTLAEVLEVARGRILVNIELKKGKKAFPYTMAELAEKTLAVVEKAGMLRQVLFSSFDPAAIDRIRELDARLPIGLITQRPWATPEEAGNGKAYPTINSLFKNLTAGNVRRAHEARIQVHAWTADTPDEMEKVLVLGVDGIITNHPDRLINLLKGRTKR